MSEKTNNIASEEVQDERKERFGVEVQQAMAGLFEYNKGVMLAGKTNMAAHCMATALTAADLACAIAVENGLDLSEAQKMVKDLEFDMQRRIEQFFPIYQHHHQQMKAGAVPPTADEVASVVTATHA